MKSKIYFKITHNSLKNTNNYFINTKYGFLRAVLYYCLRCFSLHKISSLFLSWNTFFNNKILFFIFSSFGVYHFKIFLFEFFKFNLQDISIKGIQRLKRNKKYCRNCLMCSLQTHKNQVTRSSLPPPTEI